MSDTIRICKRLKEGEELYILMSGCTRNPYVVCDPETFDDCVTVFLEKEVARRELEHFQKERIPVSLARMVQKQRLVFYTSLYTMGINAILVKEQGQNFRIQLSDVVKRMDPSKQQPGTIWVENPQLHLTALYFMQSLRSSEKMEMTPELLEMQEEISVNFGRGRFLVPVEKEGRGVPLIRMRTEEKYQPVFTDILEFQKFNKGNILRPVVVPAQKVPQVLVAGTCGVVLNPMGVNVPMKVAGGVRAQAPGKEDAPAAAQDAGPARPVTSRPVWI